MRRRWVIVGLIGAAAVGWLSWPSAPTRPDESRFEPPARAPANPVSAESLPSVTPSPATAEAADWVDRVAPTERRQQIRGALAETFRGRFEERNPTDAELERMADALERMVTARERLRQLTGRPEEGGERRRLRDEIGEAVAEFEQVANLPLAEVTKETGAGGISVGDEVEDDVVFEPIVEVEP